MNIFTTTNTLFISFAAAYDLLHLIQKINSDLNNQSQISLFIENVKKNDFMRIQFQHKMLNLIVCQIDDLDEEQTNYFLNALNRLHLAINQIFINKMPNKQSLMIYNYDRFAEDSPRKMNKLFSDKTVLGFLKNIISQQQILISEQLSLLKQKNYNNKIDNISQNSKYIETIITYNSLINKFLLTNGQHFYQSYVQSHLFSQLQTNIDENYLTGIHNQIAKCIQSIEEQTRERLFSFDLIQIDEKNTHILTDLISKRFESLKKEILERNSYIDEQCRKFYIKSQKRYKTSKSTKVFTKKNNQISNTSNSGFYSDDRKYLKQNTLKYSEKKNTCPTSKRPLSRVSYNLKQVTISDFPRYAGQNLIWIKSHSQSSYTQFNQPLQQRQSQQKREDVQNSSTMNSAICIKQIPPQQNKTISNNQKSINVQNDFLQEYQSLLHQQMQQFVQEQLLMNITSKKDHIINSISNQYLINNFRRIVQMQSQKILEKKRTKYLNRNNIIQRSRSENVIKQQNEECGKYKYYFQSNNQP